MQNNNTDKKEVSKCCGAKKRWRKTSCNCTTESNSECFTIHHEKVCSKCLSPFIPAPIEEKKEMPTPPSCRICGNNHEPECSPAPITDNVREEIITDRLLRQICSAPKNKIKVILKSLLSQQDKEWKEKVAASEKKIVDLIERVADRHWPGVEFCPMDPMHQCELCQERSKMLEEFLEALSILNTPNNE